MARRETAAVLRNARNTLSLAQLGLTDLGGDDPVRREPGFHNVLVFGRSVTWVVQNLRTIDKAAFDNWYAPFEMEMERDPLMKYFLKLRNELEKEGRADTAASYQVPSVQSEDMTNPPPGALGFFMNADGAGWRVQAPDGSIERYYVRLPGGRASLHPANPPTEHLGQPIADRTALGLSRLYLAYLGRFLDAAEARFRS